MAGGVQARPPISINTTRRDSGSPHTSAAAGVPLHQGPVRSLHTRPPS